MKWIWYNEAIPYVEGLFMEGKPEDMREAVRAFLFEHAEEQYRDFSKSLTPGDINMLGVRLPVLRKKAKELAKGNWRKEWETEDLYFEEIMLRGMMLSYVKEPLDAILPYIEDFIPRVDNWSVCDSVFSKMDIFRTDREKTWDFIRKYLYSDREFDTRVGIIIMMQHLLKCDENGNTKKRLRTISMENCRHPARTPGTYLEQIFHALNREFQPYYTSMAAAWTLAEAFCCYPKETLDFLSGCMLDDRTYNRALQKMVESRIPQKDVKDYLRGLKRKPANRQ